MITAVCGIPAERAAFRQEVPHTSGASLFLFVFLPQIPEKSLTSIPMYGTIIYYKESRKAPGKEAEK
jgi:hypothetical protein